MPICCDCKYYTPADFADWYETPEDCDNPRWCISEKCHPTLRKKKELVPWELRRPSVHNAKCDCDMYERKWWKFWR